MRMTKKKVAACVHTEQHNTNYYLFHSRECTRSGQASLKSLNEHRGYCPSASASRRANRASVPAATVEHDRSPSRATFSFAMDGLSYPHPTPTPICVETSPAVGNEPGYAHSQSPSHVDMAVNNLTLAHDTQRMHNSSHVISRFLDRRGSLPYAGTKRERAKRYGVLLNFSSETTIVCQTSPDWNPFRPCAHGARCHHI